MGLSGANIALSLMSAAERSMTQHMVKEQIEIKLSSAEKEAGISNSIEVCYLKALLRDEATHALLAAKSSLPKPQRLVPEATAVQARAKKVRRRRHAQAQVF